MINRMLVAPFRAIIAAAFFSLALFVVPLSANAQTGSWSATGSMLSPRSGGASTLLSNGKVLLTGGQDNVYTDQALASAELYDPETGTFSATGPMTTSRFDGHSATLMSNGQVLVTGGLSSGYADPVVSAEVYNPATGTFSATTGSMITTRYAATATLLPNGKVLIAGGCASANTSNPCETLGSAELYDPTTGTFSSTGSMIAVRTLHTATLLPNGKVLVAGGVDFNSYTSLASAEIYDPTTGSFSATGSMITGRENHSAALLPNGQVLVATGYNYAISSYLVSAELYNPATGTFSATGSMTTGRVYQSAALLANGEFLVVGGATTSGVLASCELYNPASGTFSATGALITALATGTNVATLLPNGQVLVAGGSNSSGTLASAELYNPPEQLSITPTSLSFGSVSQFSILINYVTVKNIGAGAISLGKVSVTPGHGTHADDFTPVSLCPSSLPVGKSCLILVGLYAGDVGSLMATLNIPNSATGSPRSVSLSATVEPRGKH